ncbi:MAG: hypothetical protein AAGA39_02930 [Pseudomonadota bacterium]
MADRLKQIWTDFADRTSVHLTAVDIEGLPRPERREQPGEDLAEFTPQPQNGRMAESDAVQAAFQALHADILAKGKNAKRRRGEPEVSFDADPAPLPDTLDQQLFADLASTDMRVRRGSSDYLAYASERQDAWKRRKKKWFFGLF